jgi:hypothetical protein
VLKKAWSFVLAASIACKNKIVSFVRGVFTHTEAIIITGLAALGLNALIGELPFIIAMPLWIEAAMVIPVLSVFAIGLLLLSAEWRASRRAMRAAIL